MATRRERVVLDVDSNAAAVFTRDAAAAALLKRELKSLSGMSVETSRVVSRDTSVSGLGKDADTTSKQIDKLSGRIALFAQAAAVLGPALIPIGAVAVPAVAGLAAQFGFAAVAGGTAIVAFQGVGTALTAMNKAHLQPTVENIAAAHRAMDAISPAAAQFVVELRAMSPALKSVRNAAADGLFPGLIASLDDLERVLPKIEGIFRAVGQAAGDLAKDSAASLASSRWTDFFTFIQDNAPQAIRELGATVGNLTHGLAEMWMAFDPLNDNFSSWLLDVSASFDQWASGLSQTQGFADFIDYIRTTGPQVAETLGALGSALLDIVTAAAPLGGPVLAGIEAFAEAISAIADSDIGTPIFVALSAMSLLSRATATYGKVSKTAFGASAIGSIKGAGSALVTVTSAAERAQLAVGQLSKRQLAMRSGFATIGKGAGLMAGLAIATTGVADKTGLANTATLGLMGTMMGPYGAAVGATVGAVMDYTHANDDLETSLRNVEAAAKSTSAPDFAARVAVVGQLDSAISHLATSQGVAASTMDAFATGLDFITGPGNLINDFQDQSAAAAEAAHNFSVQTMGLAEGVSQFYSETTAGDSSKFTTDLTKVQTQAEAVYSSLGRAGYSVEQINTMLLTHQGWDQASAAAAEYVQHADSAAGRSEAIGAAMADLDNKLISTASAADTLKNSLDALLSPGLDLSAATDAWNSGLRNLDKNLAKGNRSLTAQTDAADKNRSAIRGQVTNLEALMNAQAQAGAGAGKLARTMKHGRKAIIDAGVAAGFSRDQMRTYLNTLGLTPKMVRTIIQAQTDEALNKVRTLNAELSKVVSKTITLTVNRVGNALGGMQFDAGGWTGPGGTHDPAGIVHRDEVVLPKTIVRRDAQFLKSRYGFLPGMSDLPGYAGGGVVGASQVPQSQWGFSPNGGGYWSQNADKNMLTVKELLAALHDFSIGLHDTTADVRSDLQAFRKAIKDGGGVLNDRFKHLADRLIEVSKAIDAQREVLDKASQSLRELKDTAQQFGDSVSERFKSSIFGKTPDLPTEGTVYTMDNNPGSDTFGQWVATTAAFDTLPIEQQLALYQDWLDSQQPDTALAQIDAQQMEVFSQMLQTLANMGLTGAAFQDFATNGTIQEGSALLQMTPAELAQLSADFTVRDTVAGQLSGNAQQIAFGEALRDQGKELRGIRQELMNLQDDRAGIALKTRTYAHIENAVEEGTRKGNGKGHNGDGNNRRNGGGRG